MWAYLKEEMARLVQWMATLLSRRKIDFPNDARFNEVLGVIPGAVDLDAVAKVKAELKRLTSTAPVNASNPVTKCTVFDMQEHVILTATCRQSVWDALQNASSGGTFTPRVRVVPAT